MDSKFRDWENLPVELLSKILSSAAIEQSQIEACKFALVCKAWLPPAQAAAYSNVRIRNFSQLKMFYDAIINSPYLGTKVKFLHFTVYTNTLPEPVKIEESNRLTSLLSTSLPNLEVLRKTDLHTCVPNLHTLLDSQLRHLKNLEQPINLSDDSGFENYVKCAFMMKGRLENIQIRCGFNFLGERQHEKINIDYQRLYDSLHQFINLVDIKIAIQTSDVIQVLEYIVESCKSLKNIQISFKIPTDQPNHAREISDYIPRSTVKSLNVSIYEGENNVLPRYIMHKFPQLQKLHLRLKEENSHLDTCLIAQFLDFVSTIDEFSVSGLSTYQNNLMETIGNFWDKTSKPGNENLCINYSQYTFADIKATLQIERKISGEVSTTLQYLPHVEFEWRQYMDLITKSGKYIGAMSFDILVEEDDLSRSELPDYFLRKTLANCPNLDKLHLSGCILRNSAGGFDNKISIDELSFQHCRIQPGMFEQLSPFLYKINRLRLWRNMTYDPESEAQDENMTDQSQPVITMPRNNIFGIAFRSPLIITMSHTIINSIAFKWSTEVTYVKIFVLVDEKSYYYRISSAIENWIQPSNKQEYEAKNNEEHVYISCPTKPTLDGRRRLYKTYRF